MEIDARILGEADKENCDNMKEAVSKYGVQLVCDDEDRKRTEQTGSGIAGQRRLRKYQTSSFKSRLSGCV